MSVLKSAAVIAALLSAASTLWAQTSPLQRDICASSANLPAKVQACSEVLSVQTLTPDTRARTYQARAGAYDELGRFDLALGDYDRALALIGFDAVLFHSRGLALSRLGRHTDALKDLDRALMLRPEYGIAFETRATTLVDMALAAQPAARQTHLASALADLDQAMGLQGPDAEPRLRTSRGRVNAYLGRADAALADFTRALDLQPDMLPALSLRGAVYADLGDLEHAIIDFTRYLRREPDTRVVRAARGYSHFQSRQYDLALADLDRVVTDAPDDLAARYCRGAARLRTGDATGQTDIDAVSTRQPEIATAQAAVCPLP